MLWGGIIAIALYPLFDQLRNKLGGSVKWATVLWAVLLLMLFIFPSTFFVESMMASGKVIAEEIRKDAIALPPPPQEAKEIPLVGGIIYDLWKEASGNLVRTLNKFPEQVKQASTWLLKITASIVVTAFQTLLAIIISIVFMVYAAQIYSLSIKALQKIIGTKGVEFVHTVRNIVRSVAQGVILVALTQGLMAGIGFWLVGLPAAGLWTLLVVMLSIMQLPTVLVILPIIIYVSSHEPTAVAIIFTIWEVLVTLVDNVLRPMLIGKGANIPILIIFIGAVGGMALMGVIGLFTGPVILVLGYKLFFMWVAEGGVANEE
ncbi:AI-2E family transporter [Algivirga pacifica]|uniref:AI-2E family transporter n=2 Tax=Algivirga pacifica TaxID=1162670 RepID=A0ABP9D1X1_9BACT